METRVISKVYTSKLDLEKVAIATTRSGSD